MKSLDIYKLVEDVETGQLIHTSKIKEKIEENKKMMTTAQGEELLILDSKIDVLEELLEE